MGTNYNIKNYFEEKGGCPPINVCEPHLATLLLLDLSGSIGEDIKKIEETVNRFKNDICKDEKAAERIDICVIGFNGKVHLLQDWCPITEMENVKLFSEGSTNMSEALEVSVEKIRERTNLYKEKGIDAHIPFLIMLSDGMGNNIDSIASEIRQRTEDKKLRPWFLGIPGYDEETACKITGGERVFEVVDDNGYDFTGFFNLMKVSMKAVSLSSVGGHTTAKSEGEDFHGVKEVEFKYKDRWLK